MKNVGYVVSNSGTISLLIENNTYSINSNHVNYKAIVQALKDKAYDKLLQLLDISKSIVTAFSGKVEIKDGVIYYNNNPIHNSLTDRILSLIQQDFPVDPMLTFLENLLQNPSFRAVNELYHFLEVNKLPITEDGYFLAYKKVTDDYKDYYTQKISNKIGDNPKIPRNQVCEDKDITCASGLHFCSLSYLAGFYSGSGHIMIIKINPKDVVSIPSDYNNTKGRCCEYIVVGEHKLDEKTEAFDKALYNSDGFNYELDKDDTAYDEGYQAFLDGYDLIEENPYDDRDNITAYEQWKDGWTQAEQDEIDNQDCDYEDSNDCTGDCDICDVDNKSSELGIKPNGDKFWNVRDKSGKFAKKRK